ncbi:MAG: hypothetical protein F6K56_09945 [Moorea sp. SIO3G5]|nr:hypothetical protein [Moorena sp. SIO3G5]
MFLIVLTECELRIRIAIASGIGNILSGRISFGGRLKVGRLNAIAWPKGQGWLVEGWLVKGWLVEGWLVEGWLVEGWLVERDRVAERPRLAG